MRLRFAAVLAPIIILTTPALAAEPRRLKLATWNIEHLAERDGEGCRPRTEADYLDLRRHVAAVGADVIAFQEVESKRAAERVFTADLWTVFIEDRKLKSGGGCRGARGRTMRAQKVGFAVRRGLNVVRNPDLRQLALGRRGLRGGVDITVRGAHPIRLLALHLKAGCDSGWRETEKDCRVLSAQIPIVERWIDARANETIPFAVIGDWNRRLASRGDMVWAAVDDADPPNADLTLAARSRPRATCKAKYSEFIDHIALDRRAALRFVPGSFAEYTYGQPEALHPSDHCPISVVLGAPSQH